MNNQTNKKVSGNTLSFQHSSWDTPTMPWYTIPTLHCASYDTSYTLSSLPGLWAIKEVQKLLMCSSTHFSVLCVSGISLETETGITHRTGQ